MKSMHVAQVVEKVDTPIANEEQAASEDEKRQWRTREDQGSIANDLTSSPAENAPDPDDEIYPEGGLGAWLVVLGSFSAVVPAFGLMNTIGTFQAYLSTHQLRDFDEGTISWIFSLYGFLSFFSGVQIGPIFDAKGPRILVMAGSVLLIVSMMLLGFCYGRLSQTSSQVKNPIIRGSLLALYHGVQHLRRLGYCLYNRARPRGHCPLLSNRPRECYRHRGHRWVDWRHHFPFDAGGAFPEGWLRLEYAGDGIGVPLSPHIRQRPDPFPVASQAGW